MNAISKHIPIDAYAVIQEIHYRQTLPWNNGRIDEYRDFPNIQKLFECINSGISQEDFMFCGDLFRIHTPYVGLASDIDPQKEFLVSKVCCDGSCSIQPITEYDGNIVAFSKSYDFTRKVFYKVASNRRAIILHFNTDNRYGIDVNKLLARYDMEDKRYSDEQEVLFPISKEFLVKEYKCSPNQMRYYFKVKDKTGR